jgi:hypothetical protein
MSEHARAEGTEMETTRPTPDEALYEVQVWNVDTQTAEWSLLTMGRAVAAGVDDAEAFLVTTPDDDTIRVVVVNRA